MDLEEILRAQADYNTVCIPKYLVYELLKELRN